ERESGRALGRGRLFQWIEEEPPLFSTIAAKVIDISARLFARLAVGLLDLADELVALSLDLLEVVVCEAAPALARLALDLLPVSFDLVPVHQAFSCGRRGPPLWSDA